MKKKMKNFLYIILAFLFAAIGAVGVVMPVLPTTPFLLLASFFFARGSVRFHQWFMSTKLYQDNLKEFIDTRSMTMRNKIRILIPASLMLMLAFFLVPIIHFKIFIGIVLIFKYYYFIYRIKTIKDVDES